MPFLCVPMKKTSEVELADPISAWMSTAYGTDTSPIDTQAIQEFQKMRTNAVCRALDKHESSLDILCRYYDQLTALESKIPFGTSQVSVFFKWKDAFDKGSLFFGRASMTLASGGLERAATLFNVGSLESQIAGSQPLDNDEELKTCAKLFQQSAGIFHYLKDVVLGWVGQEPTPDMMPDTLACLSALMVAQAQEAIYIKAAKDRMKPAIVAKIAAQGSELYQEAYRQMNRESLKGLWEKESLAMAKAKVAGFEGLAHYQQSLVCKEQKEIGPELAHLLKASQMLNTSGAATIFGEELAVIDRAHQAAKKDNDFIYHERVPDVKTLSSIGKAVLAKPLPIPNQLSKNFKDLFENVVPVEVQQALASYDARRQELVNSELGRMNEGTQLLNGILSSLNLPAALEDACSASAIPQSVREKAGGVRAAGGSAELTRMIGELPTLLQRNSEILEETRRLLNEEKTTDDQFRATHKEKWTRMPSQKLAEPLWAEVGKYTGILDSAGKADGVVRGKFDSTREGIDSLSLPEDQLIARIPTIQAGAAGSSGGLPVVQQLKELMSQVDRLKSEREQIETSLKNTSPDMKLIFLRALADGGGAINEQELSTEQLNITYTPLREKISKTIQQQDILQSQIETANTEFVGVIGSSGSSREDFLKKLSAAYDTFMELRSNLQEGSKFYNDLTPLLVRLQQKVSDFCFARKTEQEDLLRELQGSGGSTRTSTNPVGSQQQSPTENRAPPPARPPPPSFGAGSTPASASQPQPAAGSIPPQQPPNMPYGNYPYPVGGWPYGQPQPGVGYPAATYPGMNMPQAAFNPYAGLQQNVMPGYNPYAPPGSNPGYPNPGAPQPGGYPPQPGGYPPQPGYSPQPGAYNPFQPQYQPPRPQ